MRRLLPALFATLGISLALAIALFSPEQFQRFGRSAVRLHHRMRLLCGDGTLKSCTMEADGEPAFYDAHHLSFGFARYVGKRIESVYGRELRAARFPEPADSH